MSQYLHVGAACLFDLSPVDVDLSALVHLQVRVLRGARSGFRSVVILSVEFGQRWRS
jgi:hypothetical protein